MVNLRQKEENHSGGLHNALANGTKINGNVFVESDFRLDGYVEGDITCNGKIVIGQKGVVKGNIISVNAEIHGEIIGTVKISLRYIATWSSLFSPILNAVVAVVGEIIISHFLNASKNSCLIIF